MPLYVCRKWQGVPQAREHAALKWVRPQQLARLPDAAGRRTADRAALRSALRGGR